LLVADVPWASFLVPAFGETSQGTPPTCAAIDEGLAFIRVQDAGATFRNWRLVGGELEGPSTGV